MSGSSNVVITGPLPLPTTQSGTSDVAIVSPLPVPTTVDGTVTVSIQPPAALTAMQIAISSAVPQRDVVYALASDGTIWSLINVPGYDWQQLPPFPPPSGP